VASREGSHKTLRALLVTRLTVNGIVRAAVMVACLGLTASGRAEGLVIDPVIGGLPMTCKDFRGIDVRTTLITQLGDVGSARIMGRMPVILLDPDRLDKLPPKLQVFFFAHECGHHVLGHSFAQTTSSENEADCWSIKYGRDHGLFTRQDVAEFAPYFAHSKGTSTGHLPGPERAARLLACFDDPSDELVEPRTTRQSLPLSASTGG
jgi:hypothetical protein